MPNDLDTNLRAALVSQYAAALKMLRETIQKCPDTLWLDASLRNQFWRVTYHTLFFVHFYLQTTEKNFVPWLKHRDEVESATGVRPDTTPYSQQEMIEYLNFCWDEIRSKVADMDFASESGFPWYRCTKLELQFLSIRHVQGHVGELSEQLSNKTGLEIDWVGSGPTPPPA